MERVDILWTGGFDSSFRVCQLSLLPVIIQPYYIRADKKSDANEIAAMSEIQKFIDRNPAKKCELLPWIEIKLKDIAPDKIISESYKRIREQYCIGSQYEWFARFSKQSGLSLEISFERDPLSDTDAFYTKNGKLREVNIPLAGGGEPLKYLEYDKNQCSEDLWILFGPFRHGLPLYNLTKLETVEAYKEIGYEAVMSMTWFCAHPLLGKPCGLCNPCATVMKTGMGFRVPFTSRLLYYFLKASGAGRFLDKNLKAVYNRYWRNITEAN